MESARIINEEFGLTLNIKSPEGLKDKEGCGEGVVYVCAMEYYSAMKEIRSWIICRDVDGAESILQVKRAARKKKQIYINACMWNLEKWDILAGQRRDKG